MANYRSPSIEDCEFKRQSNPNRCPRCGSYDIEGAGIMLRDSEAIRSSSCPVCKATWNDVYKYASTDVRYDPASVNIPDDSYTTTRLPHDVMFTYVTPVADHGDIEWRLFGQLIQAIRDIVSGDDRTRFYAKLKEQLDDMLASDTAPSPIIVDSPWGWASVYMIEKEGRVELRVYNDVTQRMLCTFVFVNDDSGSPSPWYIFHDKLKHDPQFIRDVINEAYAELIMGENRAKLEAAANSNNWKVASNA